MSEIHTTEHHHSHSHGHHHGKKKQNIPGKLIAVLHLIISLVLFYLLGKSGFLPVKYLVVIGIILLVIWGACFGLQLVKLRAVHILSAILSVLVSICLIVGMVYVQKIGGAVQKVSGVTYKTDNMVVVVRKTDRAETLLDTGSYRYGRQTAVDTENTKKMVEEVNTSLGREVHLSDYGSVQEEAQALIDGKIEAAIYNEAMNGIIEESIENYSDQVKIIYQYGIETEIQPREENVDLETKDSGVFQVYISGIDVSGPISTNSRSDVNIIMTVNTNTKQILLTNTPRDYYVPIPNISGGARDKLTHAGIYGVDASMNTLNNLYGCSIDYYVRTNFDSLVKVVDELGGVDIYSDTAFTTKHGGYSIVAGNNHLDGEQALGFCRERYALSGGDNDRGKNQEKVLTAILQKAASPSVVMNANGIINAVSDSFQTDMSGEKIQELIQMQLTDAASWNIVSSSTVGTGDWQPCFSSGNQSLYVMQPDETSVAENAQKMQQVERGETVTE